jgi:hypothetical protein
MLERMKISKNYIVSGWNGLVKSLKEQIETPLLKSMISIVEKERDVYFVTSKAEKLIDKIDATSAPFTALGALPQINKPFAIVKESYDNSLYIYRHYNDILDIVGFEVNKVATTDKTTNNVVFRASKINTKTGIIHEPPEDQAPPDRKTLEEQGEELREERLPEILYIFLSEIDVTILPVNGNNGLSRKDGKVTNDIDQEVKVVTDKWNSVVVRVGDYGVSGHFRLQPYGPGSMLRRLVYIAPFVKHGYTRRN